MRQVSSIIRAQTRFYDGTLFETADGAPRTGWHATAYADVHAAAALSAARKRAAYDANVWVTVQAQYGIRRIMNRWGAERWTLRGRDGGDVRTGLGILWRHRCYHEEAAALNRIAEQARAWQRTQGRTWMTPVEADVLKWDRYYMQNCQTMLFRQGYAEFAAAPFHTTPQDGDDKTNSIDERRRTAFIAFKLHFHPAKITELLQQIDWVYDLREALDMDGEAPIREDAETANTGRAESAAA